MVRHLPGLGGCHAAYLASTLTHSQDTVAITLTAQLMAPLSSSSGSGASARDDGRSGAGALHVGFNIAVRSSCHEVVHSIREHAAAWVRDLTLGCAGLGSRPPSMPPSSKPLLHPSVAHLRDVYRQPAPIPVLPSKPTLLAIPAEQLAAMQAQQGNAAGAPPDGGGKPAAGKVPVAVQDHSSDDDSSGDEEEVEREAEVFSGWVMDMAMAGWEQVALSW